MARATCTQKSSVRARNPRVPSRGSTIQTRRWPRRSGPSGVSSLRMASPGNASARQAAMAASASRSTALTGIRRSCSRTGSGPPGNDRASPTPPVGRPSRRPPARAPARRSHTPPAVEPSPPPLYRDYRASRSGRGLCWNHQELPVPLPSPPDRESLTRRYCRFIGRRARLVLAIAALVFAGSVASPPAWSCAPPSPSCCPATIRAWSPCRRRRSGSATCPCC